MKLETDDGRQKTEDGGPMTVDWIIGNEARVRLSAAGPEKMKIELFDLKGGRLGAPSVRSLRWFESPVEPARVANEITEMITTRYSVGDLRRDLGRIYDKLFILAKNAESIAVGEEGGGLVNSLNTLRGIMGEGGVDIHTEIHPSMDYEGNWFSIGFRLDRELTEAAGGRVRRYRPYVVVDSNGSMYVTNRERVLINIYKVPMLESISKKDISNKVPILEDISKINIDMPYLPNQYTTALFRHFAPESSVCVSKTPTPLKCAKTVQSVHTLGRPDAFSKIRDVNTFHADFPREEYYDICALWIIGTYMHQVFECYPYLYFNGIAASGKTRALSVIGALAFKSIQTTDISPSSLFRVTAALRPTVIMDEAERSQNKYNQKAADIRLLLLSSHKKGAFALRQNPDSPSEIQRFDLYSPRALGNIYGLDSVLASRCIEIPMTRKMRKLPRDRDARINDPEYAALRDALYIFALENALKIAEVYRQMDLTETGIENRAEDNWKPLLAIAKFIDDGLYEKILKFAERKEAERASSSADDNDIVLVYALYVNLVENQPGGVDAGLKTVDGKQETVKVTAKQIAEWMRGAMDDYETGIIGSGAFEREVKRTGSKWLTPQWVGYALKRLHLPEPKEGGEGRLRAAIGRQYLFTREEVKDAAERLGVIERGRKGLEKFNKDG